MNAEHSSRNALPSGTVLNGVYVVEAELGHGGVGIVYRAHHRELGPVAIKEYLPAELVVREGQSVHPVSSDSQGFFEEGLERFLQEARQLIRFRMHPGIVSCRDFFRANGTAYLVMDLEEGMSLAKLLQAREAEGRPFDETDLLTVMIPLLEGLDRVHKAGVLHRDIKPANILVRREDNRPVLIDFGAAKQEFALHSKSMAPFSPGYAAIEQVAEGQLGTWTDMYGIGAVMWRMVAGGNKPYEPPHPVRSERRAHAKFRGEADPMPSAQALGKGRFSAHILAAIDQCLALRETERVQGCEALLQRLKETRKPAPKIAAAAPKKTRSAKPKPARRGTASQKNQRAKKHASRQKTLVTVLLVTLFLCVLFFALIQSMNENGRENAQNVPPLTVTRIFDGDTFELSDGTMVELIGIDAPEVLPSQKLAEDMERSGLDQEAIQALGRRAREYAVALAEGKAVKLEYDNSNRTDMHGRTLAYVWLLDDQGDPKHLVNALLVEGGYARTVRGTTFKYRNEYLEHERKARQNKQGLWSEAAMDFL